MNETPEPETFNHAMTQMLQLRRAGSRVWQTVTQRQAFLQLSRSEKYRCAICRDTGIFNPGKPAPIYDETHGVFDQPSQKQLEDRAAYVKAYCQPVPCFNPDCTIPRPDGICQKCKGFGQIIRRGAMTHHVCRRCDGFGWERA
jgi:hypothetical protein